MSNTPKAGKVPALKYAVGGAASGWHIVVGLPGLYHPDIPVPVDEDQAKRYLADHREQVAKAREAWDAFELEREELEERRNGRLPFVDPGCPVKLVQISQAQAVEGKAAQDEAVARSRNNLRSLRKGTPDEAVAAHNEAVALAGGEEE